MTNTENNIAAQAGDEPIEFYRLVGTAEWTEATTKRIKFLRELGKGQFEFRTLYFSPRATADVEREKDADRFAFMMRVADNPEGVEAQAVEAIGNESMETDQPESVQMREFIDAAIATTKPGA